MSAQLVEGVSLVLVVGVFGAALRALTNSANRTVEIERLKPKIDDFASTYNYGWDFVLGNAYLIKNMYVSLNSFIHSFEFSVSSMGGK
jgi:hypothetical protein